MRLAQNCFDCPLCRTRKKIVWGDGPVPCRLMLLGQNPGIAEDRSGKPFVGPSGKELEYMLWRLGIRREDVYITNTTKCRGRDDQDLDPAWVETCAQKYLISEIQQVQPQLIVALGAVAAHWLIGPSHPTQMELLHGFLYRSENPGAYGCDVLPCYHPAAGLHNPSLLAQCQWDMAHIRDALDGRLPYGPRVEDQPDTLRYEIVERADQIPDLLPPGPLNVMAVDTEITEGTKVPAPGGGMADPWCMTASTIPGVSAMILASRPDLCRALYEYAMRYGFIFVIHNLMFDFDVLAEMGILVDPSKVIDTLVMAYQLQFLPKGLKPLAYRLAKIVMESYEETVRPAQHAKALEYLRMVEALDWPNPEPEFTLKTDGSPHIKRPQNIRAKVKRALTDVDKGRCDDPRARWLKMDGRDVVEQVLGPMPNGWLSDLPLEVAKRYACQDSDATVRIYPVLRRLCEERGMI